MTKQELQYLLNRYHIKPRREQGQNFLLDDEVIQSTIQAANLQPTDTILEIGPGFGVLTMELAQRVKTVIAVEQDRQIFPGIVELAKQYPALQPYNEDIKRFHLQKVGLEEKQYKLVANLPYNLTSWIIRFFLEYTPRPSEMVVMVQKEVAQRIIAVPGKMSIIAVAVQLYADTAVVCWVDRSSFYPVPNVDSAVIRISLKQTPLSADPEAVMKLVKIGFAAKRKQLQNNLQIGLKISSSDAKSLLNRLHLREDIRPQDLSVEDWEKLRLECQRANFL